MAWHSYLGMQQGEDITMYSFARYHPWHTQSLANICICTVLPASLICTLRQKWSVCCAVAKLLSISKFMIQDHRKNLTCSNSDPSPGIRSESALITGRMLGKEFWHPNQHSHVFNDHRNAVKVFQHMRWINTQTNKKLNTYSWPSQNKVQHCLFFLFFWRY